MTDRNELHGAPRLSSPDWTACWASTEATLVEFPHPNIATKIVIAIAPEMRRLVVLAYGDSSWLAT
ncbi:MAG: hypothetical protein JJE13_13085 [Thermoleophilia bacterium]|nr:hypothetical protein [Thermoleophilia bacterium]